MVLPNVDASQAYEAAQRVRAHLAERQLPHSGSTVSPFVTLSIGVAELDPRTMNHFDLLLQCADQALYRAKHQGRNCVAF